MKRDFKAISEPNGAIGKIGEELHGLPKNILKLRKQVRDGTLQWETFQLRMPELQQRVESLLKAGANASCAGPGLSMAVENTCDGRRFDRSCLVFERMAELFSRSIIIGHKGIMHHS